MKSHFEEKHKTLLHKHEHLWKISNIEQSEMKKIWEKRGRVYQEVQGFATGCFGKTPCANAFNVSSILMTTFVTQVNQEEKSRKVYEEVHDS
jgi:hypothetical protein